MNKNCDCLLRVTIGAGMNSIETYETDQGIHCRKCGQLLFPTKPPIEVS